MRSAKARAAELVRKIERAIERGEFVPENSYLWDLMYVGDVLVQVGACGCAFAAHQYVSGDRDFNMDNPGDEDVRLHGLSRSEAMHLEAGYENCADFTPADFDHESPFYAAGRELRKFHPDNSEAS